MVGSIAKVKIRGDGRPVRLGYGLADIPQAGVPADGDGEADRHLTTDGEDGVGIEAAVGAHCELSTDTAVAYPAHRFAQEVGGGASGVDPALAQPRHQHVAGAGPRVRARASSG